MSSDFNNKDPWDGQYKREKRDAQNSPGEPPFYNIYKPHKNRRNNLRTAIAVVLIICTMGAIFYFTLISGFNDNTGNPGESSDNFSTAGLGQAKQLTPVQSGAAGGDVSLTIVDIPDTPAPSMTVDDSGRAPLTIAQIAKKAIPSVVGVISESSSSYSSGSGSGIIMDASGYIVTNYHVIEDADAITVVLDSGQSYEAALIGFDSQSDLAVLKIEAKNLTPAEFGNSEALEAGDLAVAIGNPMGLELQSTVTSGIISAIDRNIAINDRSMTMIQTDASINPGNSGGPLINEYGQVIGINTVKYVGSNATYSEGLGFAIPINTAKPIIDELIQNGYIKGKPAIGISGLTISERMQAYYGYPKGVLITDISESSDAYKKGLRTGDIIVGVNGTQITDMNEINTVKNEFAAGDTIILNIYRNEKAFNLEIKLIDSAELMQEQ